MGWRATVSGGLTAVLAWSSVSLCQVVEAPLAGIKTTEGVVEGKRLDSGVKAWLGIPFAAPPTNALRWEPPHPTAWKGTWHADRFMPECIQPLRRHDTNNYFGEEATSEDCLYLNVWAPPSASPSSKLPVIVYIFGGGNTIGSPAMGIYHGDKVAARGAVFVSVNYRLGILGFMAHPALSAEQSGHSGNYAYLDQQYALQWVHDNIALFGGDPNRVSIVGQSAGAQAVALHLVSPLSKGLFSSAVMLSACRLDFDVAPLAQAERIGMEVQDRLGAASLDEMRQIPADQILRIQSSVHVAITLDGRFLTKSPLDAIRDHEDSDVPIIASSNGDDSDVRQNPISRARTIGQYRDALNSAYGADADTVLKLYPVDNDSDVLRAGRELAQDAGMQGSSRRCAQIREQYDTARTFVSLFDRRHPYLPAVAISDLDQTTVGVYHSSDVAYWLGTLDAYNSVRPTRMWTGQDRNISNQMIDALIAFSRSGNPSTQSVVWPAWHSDHEERVVIDQSFGTASLRAKQMSWLQEHKLAVTSHLTRAPRKDAD